MDRFLKRYRTFLFIALIFILLPLAVASVYNRPSSDDLCQPEAAHIAIQNGGGFFSVVVEAIKGTLNNYYHWNGCYFSIFLSFFSPTLYNHKIAYIHPIFYLIFFSFSTYYFAKAIGKTARISNTASACLGLLLCCMYFLLVPDISEAIYWYTGANGYSFMFFFSLLLYGGTINWCFSKEKIRFSTVKLTLLSIGFLLLGGANFTTSTVTIVMFFYLLVYIFIKRKEKRWIIIPFLSLIIGYVIAVFAPGNAVRSFSSEGYTLFPAFFYTLRDTYSYLLQDWSFYTFLLFFIPILINITKQSNFSFKHPLTALILSFLVVAAGFMPPEYSMRALGPPRILNIQFYLTVIFYLFNITYLIGFANQLVDHHDLMPADTFISHGRNNTRVWMSYLLTCTVLFGSAQITNVELSPFRFNSPIPSVKAISNLIDGQLKDYADKYDELVDMISNHPDEDFVTSDLFINPLFYNLVILEDKTSWWNRIIANYYGCRSIQYIPLE